MSDISKNVTFVLRDGYFSYPLSYKGKNVTFVLHNRCPCVLKRNKKPSPTKSMESLS